MAKKVTLKHPIEAHGKMISELELGEPDLGCLDDVEIAVNGSGQVKLNLGDIHKIVASMADIPPSSAKKIKLSDCLAMVGEIQGFLQEFLPTGGN